MTSGPALERKTVHITATVGAGCLTFRKVVLVDAATDGEALVLALAKAAGMAADAVVPTSEGDTR